jgi:hypothetical protein
MFDIMKESSQENEINSLLKEISLYNYMKKGPLSNVEAMLHLIDIFNLIEMEKSLSSEKFLLINLNSSNIKINRFLDLKINFVRVYLKRLKNQNKTQIIFLLNCLIFYIFQMLKITTSKGTRY